MEYRNLGLTDLKTAPVVFGGNVLGWTLNETQSFDILDRFVDAGFNAIDTADSYSHWAPGNVGGESETILGKWFKSRKNRDKIMLISKVGSDPIAKKRNVHKDYIIRAAEESLRRLQTDHIDLYMTHWDNKNTPVQETLDAYRELIDAGKVRYIGASNVSPERIEASLQATHNSKYPCYRVLQPEYNLYDRKKFESVYYDLATTHALGVITYYSLASGFLSGKYRTEDDLKKSQRGASIKKYLNTRGMRILDALDRVAAAYGVEPAAVALAWVMQRPAITAPIASATKPEHIQAFTQAATLKMSEEHIRDLNNASAYETEEENR